MMSQLGPKEQKAIAVIREKCHPLEDKLLETN